MNILYFLLEAGEAVAEGQQKTGLAGNWQMWAMLILIFVIMWLFMIRPQRKQQKELQKFRDSLEKGSKVVTAGGIYGKVVEIQDRTILIEVDNGVKLKVDKSSVLKDYSDAVQK